MPYTQDTRIASVHSVLGEDALLLRRLVGHEAISRLFELSLDLASELQSIDFAKIIGTPIRITIRLQSGATRHICGIVSRFYQGGGDRRLSHYRAEVVPSLWRLTRCTNSRIFQDLSVPEIVKTVLQRRGITDIEDRLTGSYAPRVYCAQYRETDYQLVCRLMEQEGISFCFSHHEKGHAVVLFDSPAGNRRCAQATAMYAEATDLYREGEVWDLGTEQSLAPGAYTLTDYEFERPSLHLGVSTATLHPVGGNEALEIYEHPGEYGAVQAGERLVRLRMEAEEAAALRITGQSACAAFQAGDHFTLAGHYRTDRNQPYLLTEVRHALEQPLVVADGAPATYENGFAALPYAIPFRPKKTTRKPAIQGVQIAMVVGPPGEDIYVDKYGRVKIQFYWDRDGQRDEHSSCWVRVSQPWAGKSWGSVSIPRIGQEVLVDFIDGDPDRPTITGRVYNGEQMPPYELPAGAHQMGLKSRSTPGGGGYNEISLSDTKGNEGVTIHAQYDMNTTVEHDEALTVHNDRTTTVDVNHTESVGVDQTVTVGSNQSTTVGANRTITVAANQSSTIGGAAAETIAIAKALSIGGAYQVSVGGIHNESVGGAKTSQVGAFSMEMVGGYKTMKVGEKLSIDVGEEITITCGAASITLTQGGEVLIKGSHVKLEGDPIDLN
jgi:type VI secretion system secreted protein VgrG